MRYDRGRRWSIYISFICLISFAVIGVEFLHANQQRHLRSIEQQEANEELSLVRSRLEALIVSDIYAVNSLAALVAADPDVEFINWDEIARSIRKRSTHVTVIGLAPNDVIRHIYPREGNERAIGLDYRTVPKQWASVQKAREIQETLISGPIELVQGGFALIARVPIFTDPPFNNDYWGVCSVVIGLKSLFQDAGVYSLIHRYDVAVRGIDSSGDSGDVFFGDEQVFNDAFAIEEVHFPYGDWSIAISPKHDLLSQVDWYQIHGARILGYPILLVIVLAFYAVYRLYHHANHQALHDELTRLPNRRYFMCTLEHQFEAASKLNSNDSFAVLNIDLDKFKSINDNFGHNAGDKVLISIAQRVQGVLRASDVVARVGGDEFLVLLPRVSKREEIESIITVIEKSVSHTPVVFDQQLINLQVSIGYALYKTEFTNIEQMLKLADTRMYETKKSHARRFG